MKHRTYLDIINEILKYCNGKEQVVSHIMGSIHLSFTQWKTIMPKMVESNLLVINDRRNNLAYTTYKTTSKGMQYISTYEALVKLAS